MKKTFKKIAASIVAVTSLVVSMTSFSANAAVEPRYGGYGSFTINGASVTTYIDVAKSAAGASTNSSKAKDVYVSITGYNTDGSTTFKYDSDDDGSASVNISPSGNSDFTKCSSNHTATYLGATGSKTMTANAPS